MTQVKEIALFLRTNYPGFGVLPLDQLEDYADRYSDLCNIHRDAGGGINGVIFWQEWPDRFVSPLACTKPGLTRWLLCVARSRALEKKVCWWDEKRHRLKVVTCRLYRQ